MKFKGYMGKILRLDLTRKKSRVEPLTDTMARLYLGGNGFAVKIIYNEVKPGIEPYDPYNKLIFAVGPVNGIATPYGQRFLVASKSPLTGLYFDSICGGHISAMIKKAGYDTLIVEGKASQPSYIYIDEDQVEFLDANSLWGLKTFETAKALKETHGQEIETACIGPGGEKLVRYACIIAGMRASGRGGMGAVMGSKNLKALAVKGHKPIEIYDKENFVRWRKDESVRIKQSVQSGALQTLSKYGTPSLVEILNGTGRLGTRNWNDEVFDRAAQIGAEKLKTDYVVGKTACFSCSVACGMISKLEEWKIKGPEYETLYAFGSLCGISDLKSIIAANLLCDEYGIDTMSAGVAIAFAMECYEKGIISKIETDGIDLNFGNSDSLLAICRKIAERKGFGKDLGEGVYRASLTLGKGSEQFAMHTKGLEYAGHSPRVMPGMAIAYATATRGGSHHDGRPFEYAFGVDYDLEKKVETQIKIQNCKALEDSMVICHFYEKVLGFTLGESHLKLINLITGMGLVTDDLEAIGERIYNLERLFNVREGITRIQDTLPERFLNQPIPRGPNQGLSVGAEQLNKMLDHYYKIRGWDKEGRPAEKKLGQLDLM